MHTRTTKDGTAWWVAGPTAVVVVVASFLRLHFGVDFSDESYYVSLAYRFCLGDAPFRDELHLGQTAALITWPFVKAFVGIAGSTDGLVLFTRRLYLLVGCGVAGVAWLGLRQRIPAPAALVISLVCIAFVPLGIPNLSYNTLGSFGFTLGVFLAAPLIFEGEARSFALAASGVAHGIAILAYPPLLVPAAGFALVLCLLATRSPMRAIGIYAAGGLAVGVLLAGVTELAGLERVYQFMQTSYGPSDGKFAQVLRQLAQSGPEKAILLPWMALLWWQGRRRPAWVIATLPLLPLLFAWPLLRLPLWKAPTHYVASWGAMGLLLLPLVWQEVWARRLFWGAWCPALVAGVTVAWSSTNGYTNAGVGMLPAAVVTTAYLYQAIRAAARSTGGAWRPAFALPLVGVLIVLAIGLNYQRGIYMGGEVLARKRPVVTVDWGPYRGLRTVTPKNDFLRVLAEDLGHLADPSGRIIFYDHFPPGYLLTGMRPATPSIYSCFLLTAPGPSGDPGFCARHYARTLSEPNVAVHVPPVYILGNRLRPNPLQDLALDRVVKEHLRLVVARVDQKGQELYQIFASDVLADAADEGHWQTGQDRR